jgi:molybdopterin converting factor small subunit
MGQTLSVMSRIQGGDRKPVVQEVVQPLPPQGTTGTAKTRRNRRQDTVTKVLDDLRSKIHEGDEVRPRLQW